MKRLFKVGTIIQHSEETLPALGNGLAPYLGICLEFSLLWFNC